MLRKTRIVSMGVRKQWILHKIPLFVKSRSVLSLTDHDNGGWLLYDGLEPAAYFNLYEVKCTAEFGKHLKSRKGKTEDVIRELLSFANLGLSITPKDSGALVLWDIYTSDVLDLKVPVFDLCQLWADFQNQGSK